MEANRRRIKTALKTKEALSAVRNRQEATLTSWNLA